MTPTLLIHITAGGIALVAGYVALYAAKGATLHRQSGILFVYAMLTMSLFGMVVAIDRNVAPEANISAALLSAYLVITALTTVRPPVARMRWLNIGGMLVALIVGVVDLTFGFQALAAGGSRNGVPAFPFFMFGVVGLVASTGDYRTMRSGALRGARRIARHLWRMSFALFIAALSFFLGQAKVIPEPIRIPALLALPVVAVLVTMFYWLWRVRVKQSLRGIVGVGARQSA